MTKVIAEESRLAASHSTEIFATNPKDSPPAIEGPADGEAALPHLFELFDQEMEKSIYDAVIIACFDDTGLWELKARASIPVIGIGEAGFHAAMLLGKRFSVVTTLPISVPVIEQNIADQGMVERCVKVRATSIPVLELEADPDAAKVRIASEIEAALESDGCDAIVLGCAGMANTTASLNKQFEIPIIDGVKAAIGLCETLHNLGNTSMRGAPSSTFADQAPASV